MNQAPFVTIPLQDGTQATVARDALRMGERTFAIDDIQDARQVAPDPVTIALRVANERHVVELQPAQPGDGALLLEALFRLRPELRPAGFEPPTTIPAGFPPLPAASQPSATNAWGAHPSWPPHPGMYPPPSGQYAPSAPPYAPRPVPRAPGGRLSAYPRTAVELIGATFELFVAHWKRWLALGLVALFVPQAVSGVVDAVFHVLSGGSLWAGMPSASQSASGGLGITGTALPTGNDLALTALNLLLSALLGALIGGWSAAVFGGAVRDALFGRAPQLRPALRAGVRRVLPAMGTSILGGALVLLILLPVLLLYGIIIAQYGAALADPTSLDPSSPAAATFTVLGCLALLLLVPCGVGAIYVAIRLTLAAYIAATEPLGPVAALRKSWNLTRGQWWHTFLPVVVVALLASILSLPASFVQYASFGVATLVAIPLFAALTAPLVAIVAVGVLYDLRLRREGFAPLAGEANADEKPVSTPV